MTGRAGVGAAVAARWEHRHVAAIGQAVLVTFLWSTSWVLIKVGLDDLDLPPLSFAGLRYVLAAMLLLPLGWRALSAAGGLVAARPLLGPVAVLGVLLYAVTQGAQYAALVHLPAVAVGLALTTTPAVVALLSRRAGERPSGGQLLGIGLLVCGAALYFRPLGLGPAALLGLAIAGVGVVANASAAVLGRRLARDAIGALGGAVGLTTLSMAVGSIVLLAAGVAVEGVPVLDLPALAIVGWLAVVNTAFAFTLWNHTLRTLTAVESSVINNLMLVQIAVLAWLFLGETLDGVEMAGLAIALGGILLVQLRRPQTAPTTDATPATIPAGAAAPDAGAAAPPAAGSQPAPDAGSQPAASRILLVGMMGSGKTTIGRLLSVRTGYRYVDNDELLARVVGLTPREILGQHGEEELRVRESQALTAALAVPPPCIVGVAAGTILDEADRRRLRSGGTVVWLRGTLETLTRRAAGSRHRAWLEGGGRDWIRDALAERERLYLSVADVIVDVDERTPAEVVDDILERLPPPDHPT